MDIETIRSFLAVAKHKSISKAAASLYLTQPALSQRLRRLEENLGFGLLERDWTGTVLTRQGAYFLPYAAQLVRDLADASKVLSPVSALHPRSFAEVVQRSGTVVIGVDSWLPERSVQAVVQAARTRFGIDDLKVTVRPATTIIDLLDLNQLHVGIFYSADPEYPFPTHFIGTEEMALIHPEGTTLPEASQARLAEFLAGYRFVLFDNPVLTHHAELTTRIIEAYGITRFHIVDDYRTMLALIRLGECITIVPSGTTAGHQLGPGSGLVATPLPNVLPDIAIAVGISAPGEAKGLHKDFADAVARHLSGSDAPS